MEADLGKLVLPTDEGKRRNNWARPAHADQYFEALLWSDTALLTTADLVRTTGRNASAGETRHPRGVTSAGTGARLCDFMRGLSDNVMCAAVHRVCSPNPAAE
jgi:hypothetical protein